MSVKSRVAVIRGKRPIIFVSPHAADENHTDILVAEAAKEIGGWAIINNGFKRSTTVDVIKDRASCHRIDHILQPVVEDEFLNPIKRAVKRSVMMLTKGKNYYWLKDMKNRIIILYVYNCSNQVHTDVQDDVGVILGYGQGLKTNSFTCAKWRKNLFTKLFDQYENGRVYEGSPGGKFSARGGNNITQYFRQTENDPLVESLQLAFPKNTTETPARAIVTGMILASTVDELVKYDGEFNGSVPPRLI